MELTPCENWEWRKYKLQSVLDFSPFSPLRSEEEWTCSYDYSPFTNPGISKCPYTNMINSYHKIVIIHNELLKLSVTLHMIIPVIHKLYWAKSFHLPLKDWWDLDTWPRPLNQQVMKTLTSDHAFWSQALASSQQESR
jgi:hypothetical protein